MIYISALDPGWFGVVSVGMLGVLHALALWAAPRPRRSTVVAGAVALLCIFVASALPGFDVVSGGDIATAATLAALGSAPMWALALWLAVRASRERAAPGAA
ncbi:hypothetical protein [Sanguibacter suaedae]|uniref:Uncharacterized protein n=1 Tax=Sanguibacter suaedae TaxID=2795737 RepID=A0A934I1L3_9MICO|nr:hypothetical protein [Sanguibacter suaedae]MBI9113523.1 hypothetical protein [Sanguibacter suaedae]